MKPKISLLLRFGLLLVAIVFAIQACGTPSELPKMAGGVGTSQPATTITPAPSDRTTSGETAVLPNASAGLADLKTYHAILQIDAKGSLDGQPFERSSRLEITRSGSGDFDSQVQSTDSKAPLRLLALGGAYYRWNGAEASCQGSVNPPDEDEVIEPAGLLLPLGAANRVGVETVNQVSAVHYSFDQSALPQFKSAGELSGDVWVAEMGGYVVRYNLTAAPPNKSSGKGLEVSQTYQYELTSGSPALTLPKGCLPVPVDLPVVDGAQNVNRAGGIVTFDTATNPRAVIDYYGQNLPAWGWKAEKAGPTGEVSLPIYYDFTNGGLRLTVNLAANEDQTIAVALIVVDAAAQAAEAPHPTQTPSEPDKPLPTIDPAQSGLPSNVPLYPGATSLMRAGSAVMFQSSEPWENVAGFYRKQLEAQGWASDGEQPLENGVSMIWRQDGKMLILTIMVEDGKTHIVVSLP